MPVGSLPVPPVVDVQVAHDDSVERVGLGRPVQHGLEPRGVGGQLHARERSDRLVGEVQGVEWGPVDDVRDDLVAHEDVLQQVLKGAVRAALAQVGLRK